MSRRKRIEGAESRIRAMRATDEEWQRWTDAAAAKGLSRSEWIRQTLDRAAKRQGRK